MKIKIFLLLGTILLSLSVLRGPVASAIASQSSLAQAVCGSTNQNIFNFSTSLSSFPSGSLYIRLANQPNPAQVSVYYQTINGQCYNIDDSIARFSKWQPIGSISSSQTGTIPGTFIVQSSSLNVPPYEAAADILILPNNSICDPTVQCFVNYDGYSGYIQPRLLSTATDQVAIFEASPIRAANITKVDYYDGNTFLYRTTSLQPVNTNYLNGGNHNVTIVITQKNGEQALLSKKINMGPDYTGSLYAKSLLYKSHGVLRLTLIILAIVIVLITALGIARHIYKHHKYVLEHGLEHNIEPVVYYPDDTNHDMRIG